jgi:hypothetical protein
LRECGTMTINPRGDERICDAIPVRTQARNRHLAAAE